jgi:competence protein ComEC
VDYGEASFLFTGDLEEHGIERLIERAPQDALDADVYAVGHHGSYNGTTQGLLDRATPEIAVISMGPHDVQAQWTAWAYGHPRRTLVELLDRSVTRRRPAPADVMVADAVRSFSAYRMRDAIYATGWDGDVVISSGPEGRLDIATSRRP